MDYYLAVFGFTFALGNLWRFPYQCQQNGGAAYFIAYGVLFVVGAIPILFLELALGQFISLGPTSLWKVAPLFKGLLWQNCLSVRSVNFLRNWHFDGFYLRSHCNLFKYCRWMVDYVRTKFFEIHASLGNLQQSLEHRRYGGNRRLFLIRRLKRGLMPTKRIF